LKLLSLQVIKAQSTIIHRWQTYI